MSLQDTRPQSTAYVMNSEVARKFELNLPEYEGTDQVVELP